jgi:hypothetical protein
MANTRNRFPARRRFLKQSAALSAGAVAVGAPLLALGQGQTGDGDAAAGRAQGQGLLDGAARDRDQAAADLATRTTALPARRRRGG